MDRKRRMMSAQSTSVTQQLMDGAPFVAQLTKTLALQRGTGSPNFTRATAATVMGYGPTANSGDAQTLLTVASGEARFVGARRISEGVWSDTFADGTLIPASSLLGYLAEGARTQIIATADIRDMTTAGWTLGATLTRARTSVGADGAANSATRLTGGAVAATNTITYLVTAAASSRTYSALVKRVTGTGPIRISQDAFATSTDISSLINSTTYTLVQLNASQLNAVMGFKVDTNGDAIDVDFNQFEAGSFASSRIATASTRNADVLTYPSAGNMFSADGWIYAEVTSATTSDFAVICSSSSSVRLPLYAGVSGTKTRMYDGTNDLVLATYTRPNTVPAKLVNSFSGAVASGIVNGGTVVTGAYAGLTPNIIGVGVTVSTGVGQPFGTIRNVRLGQRGLSSSELQAITK